MMDKLLNLPRTQIAQWGRRVPVRADHLNQMVDTLNRLSSGVEPPRQVRRSGHVVLTSQQFIIVAIYDAYLHCHTWSGNPGDEGNTLIPVARPWGLRASPTTYTRDGKTYEYRNKQERLARIATPPGRAATEIQYVTPDYFSRNVILGLGGIHGGVVGELLPAGITFQWLDITGGREWAAFPE